MKRRLGLPAALAGWMIAGLGMAGAVTVYDQDFDANDGGYTVTSSGPIENPWVYSGSAGTWQTDGTQNAGSPSASLLTSPVLPIPESGQVLLTFLHRYSFEYSSIRWDGGAVFASTNGGGFAHVPGSSFLANGYVGTVQGNNVLNGLLGFNGDSAGYGAGEHLSSRVLLGPYAAGDTLALRFTGAWDEFAKGRTPNWDITRVQVSVIPEPTTMALLGLLMPAVVAAAGARRRRR